MAITQTHSRMVSDVDAGSTYITGTLGTGANNVVQLTAASKLPAVDGSLLTNVNAGKVLQTQQTVVTAATFTTTSTSWTDLTGMSVSITPATTGSKILLTVNFSFDTSATTNFAAFKALRGAVDLSIGDAAGSRVRCALWGASYSNQATVNRSMTWLDSPSTTSATTYKLQIQMDGGTFVFNRAYTDTDNASFPRTISTITATEIGA